MKYTDIEYLNVEPNNMYSTLTEKVINKCFETENLLDKNINISIIFTTPVDIQEYNKEYRNIDRATDVLSLENNLTNIDIGLINKNKFSLDIKKYVSKIVVQNSTGTKTYEQKEGTTLAKAEIKAKNLKDSLVVIEYKIKITNVGEVEGYAKNIEDILPSSLTFKSSMNSDWYKSGANLYNSSLANTPIKPGESRELTLTLTKTMTESNSGLINNKAKIEKSSNSQGTENKNDSIGSANVIISVSTGALINYIVIVLVTFIVMGLLAYVFVKKILIK